MYVTAKDNIITSSMFTEIYTIYMEVMDSYIPQIYPRSSTKGKHPNRSTLPWGAGRRGGYSILPS